MKLATYEIDITIEQPSFSQKVGQCYRGEVWRHNGLSAPKLRNEIVVNVNRAIFLILKFNIASAIRHFHYNIPAIRPLWCHSSKVAHPYGLRKCKRPTSDTYRYTELLKCDQIGKIPT